MTTHTIDTFVDTPTVNLESHTPDSGGPWTNVDGTAGTYIISSSGRLSTASTGADGSWSVPVGSGDMFAELTIGTNWINVADFGPCIRLQDKNNFVGIDTSSATVVNLFKRVAGTLTNIGSATGLTLAAGDKWRVSATGSSITVTQNGTSRITASDAALSTVTTAGLEYHVNSARVSYATRWESDANGGATFQAAWAVQATQGVGGGYSYV